MDSGVFGILFFAAVGVLFAWGALRGLRTGRALLGGGRVERATRPGMFWLVVAGQGALVLLCAYAVAGFAKDLLPP